MKKVLFSLSSYKIKEEPVKVFPSLFINLQCSFILIVLPLLRCSNSNPLNISVKIVEGGLCSFLFSLFYFYFYFSIFRTAWVRVDWSRCHISHKLMAKSQD